MSRVDYPEPIKELILNLKRLPGIGPRSAERIALWMHGEPAIFSENFASAITEAKAKVAHCHRCGFFTSEQGCGICQDSTRQTDLLCVVEQAVDVLALDKTGAFRGQFQVLGGKLSPLQHIGPEDLNIVPLLERLKTEPVTEVILALSNDVEGEATSNYLADRLSGTDIKISRLAQGLPAGGGLDHADELTLFRALSGRTPLGSS